MQQEGDLSRVRGRIGFLQDFRRNIIVGRADRVFCRYSELSVNTCENRLIKRALLFAEQIVGKMLDQGQRRNPKLETIKHTVFLCVKKEPTQLPNIGLS